MKPVTEPNVLIKQKLKLNPKSLSALEFLLQLEEHDKPLSYRDSKALNNTVITTMYGTSWVLKLLGGTTL